MNRRIRTLAAILFLTAAAGCERSRGGPPPTGAERLDGLWEVELTLQDPLQLGRSSAQPPLRGELALLRKSGLARVAGLSGVPTHTGSYTARFRPFGFEISGGREVPALVGRLTAGDTVEIALQPEREDHIRMRGVLAGDSIAGGWSYSQHRGGSASGRFVMRRP